MTGDASAALGSRLRHVLPVLTWLPRYDKAWLPLDLVAGLTVWALIVPEAMAYAGIAGVPVQFGLYAVPLSLLAYAAFGSCRELFVGPSATVASLSAATVGAVTLATSDGGVYVALTALLAGVVGVVYLVGGLLRLGFIANFFARPVLDGFIIGLGLYIAIGQLSKLVGIEKPSGNSAAILAQTIGKIASWQGPTVAVGAVGLAVLFALKRFALKAPAAIIVVVLSILAARLLDLSSHGVKVVGDVPTGFHFASYSALSWSEIAQLLPGALAIVVVGFAQSIAIAKAYSVERHYKVDPSQEMLGYAAANIGAGVLQGYTVTGSLSKSAAAQEARAKTPIAMVFAGALVLMTVLFLAGLFKNLPEAILAAVVIEAVSGMLKVEKLTALRRTHSVEFWAAVAALAGVVLVGILPGVVIGVTVSFALLIHALDHPHIARLGRSRDGLRYVDADADRDATTTPTVLVERFEAPLVFTNSELFITELLQRVRETKPPPRTLVLDFEAISHLDVTGAEALRQIHDSLEREGVHLVIARANGSVRTAMERTGVLGVIGSGNVVTSVREGAEMTSVREGAEMTDQPWRGAVGIRGARAW